MAEVLANSPTLKLILEFKEQLKSLTSEIAAGSCSCIPDTLDTYQVRLGELKKSDILDEVDKELAILAPSTDDDEDKKKEPKRKPVLNALSQRIKDITAMNKCGLIKINEVGNV